MFLQLEALHFAKAGVSCQKLIDLLVHPHVKNNDHLAINVKERIIEFKLDFYLRSYQYKKALDYYQVNRHEIEFIYPKVDEFRRLVIDYTNTLIFLSNHQAKEANNCLVAVFSNKVLKQHQYIYSGAMIVNLLTHFELGNYQLLESLLLNTYRMMYKRKLLYSSEKIILKYLKKYLRIQNNHQIMQSFQTLKQELQAIRSKKFEQNFLPNFDLVVWIESKIKEKSMASIAQNKGLSL